MSDPLPSLSEDAARLERASEIFFAVRALGLADRDEAITKTCAGDVKLRELVMLLLRGADAPMPIEGLADDIRAAADRAADGEHNMGAHSDGDRIGNYRLISRIGEGGFGMVFMAEQERPVRRRVALKIIKLGMDTRQVVARFEAERQALALMDHPNIAKVFDAGATQTGRPYFRDGTRSGRPSPSIATAEAEHSRAAGSDGAGVRGAAARPPEGRDPPRHQAQQRAGVSTIEGNKPCPRSSTSASPRPRAPDSRRRRSSPSSAR
jgi:hypothetical protein